MLDSGYTKLTVVARGSSSSVTFGLYNYVSADSTCSTAVANSRAVTTDKLTTFTFDLKVSTINDCLSLNVTGAIEVRLYIYEISFSK